MAQCVEKAATVTTDAAWSIALFKSPVRHSAEKQKPCTETPRGTERGAFATFPLFCFRKLRRHRQGRATRHGIVKRRIAKCRNVPVCGRSHARLGTTRSTRARRRVGDQCG